MKCRIFKFIIFYFIEVDNKQCIRLLLIDFLHHIFQSLHRHCRCYIVIDKDSVIFPSYRRLKEFKRVGCADKNRVKAVFRLLIETRNGMKWTVVSGIKHRLNTAKHQNGKYREKQCLQQLLHCAHGLIYLFQYLNDLGVCFSVPPFTEAADAGKERSDSETSQAKKRRDCSLARAKKFPVNLTI